MKSFLLAAFGLLPGFALATAPPADTAGAGHVVLDHVHREGGPVAVEGVPFQRFVFEPAASPTLTMGTTTAWPADGELHVPVQNVMPWAVTLSIDVEGMQAGRHLHAQIGLPAGPPQVVVVPLHATGPRDMGMQVAPPMPFDDQGQRVLVATTVEGEGKGPWRAVRFGIPAPQAAQTLLFGSVGFHGDAGLQAAAYRGIVDRYGQAVRGHWPEKIDSDEALRAAHATEQRMQALADTERNGSDAHGGDTAAGVLQATGWFHVQKRQGRWWLATPEGHSFFSLGVNAVAADGGRTYVEGRESMFVDLPPDHGEWAAFHGRGDNRNPEQGASQGNRFNHGGWFDFYAANLYRVDGTDWLAAWRKRSLQRLRAWGFNTIGNWSDPALGQAHQLPYTRSINIAGDYASVASGFDWWGRMPDPFDPRFVQAAEKAVAKASVDVCDDRWLLGYFADNELAWAGAGPQGRWGLALGTLAGEARSPAKQVFIAMLRKQYVTADALGAAWGIRLESWAALDATGFAAPLPDEAHPAIVRDYSAWLRRYADTYFRTVAEAIRRHDPHHLFLGGRFAVNTPEAVAACAAWCDVVSFNVYADLPQHGFDSAAMHALDKPVLISEFHFGSDDRGPFGKGVVSVWNEGQRGKAYARFIEAAAADPAIVGVHWFQYADQPVTGRLLDGENSHIGLVGITDMPFGGFVEAVSKAHQRLPQQHASP